MIIAITRPDLYEMWAHNMRIKIANPDLPKTKLKPLIKFTSEPECGFFRVDSKKYQKVIAIFCQQEVDEQGEGMSDERLVALSNGFEVDVDDIWTWCQYPISEDEYHKLMQELEE